MTKQITAGSLESNDALVSIRAQDKVPNTIELTSIVIKQFGAAIQKVVEGHIAASGLSAVHVTINDRGALECTLKARLETAIKRYKELA